MRRWGRAHTGGRWGTRWVRQLWLWVSLRRLWRRSSLGSDIWLAGWRAVRGGISAGPLLGLLVLAAVLVQGLIAALVSVECGAPVQAIVVRRTRFLHSYHRRKRNTKPSWLFSRCVAGGHPCGATVVSTEWLCSGQEDRLVSCVRAWHDGFLSDAGCTPLDCAVAARSGCPRGCQSGACWNSGPCVPVEMTWSCTYGGTEASRFVSLDSFSLVDVLQTMREE